MMELTAVKRRLRDAHNVLLDAATGYEAAGDTDAAKRCKLLAYGIAAEIEYAGQRAKLPIPARIP